jgi:hypothetical protein
MGRILMPPFRGAFSGGFGGGGFGRKPAPRQSPIAPSVMGAMNQAAGRPMPPQPMVRPQPTPGPVNPGMGPPRPMGPPQQMGPPPGPMMKPPMAPPQGGNLANMYGSIPFRDPGLVKRPMMQGGFRGFE